MSVQRKIQNYSCGWKRRDLLQGELSLDNLCLRMQLEEQGEARELHEKCCSESEMCYVGFLKRDKSKKLK